MIILPAIDILDGQCVRLKKGEFSTAHKVCETIEKAAEDFTKSGADWLHVVDLDGAKTGSVINKAPILKLCKQTQLKIEVGGGIRNLATIEDYLTSGVARVILGSVALKDPELVKKACSLWGEKIAVGIDAKDGLVAAEGWLKGSKINYLDLAKSMEAVGVSTIIYTDISRDGMLGGINTLELEKISKAVSSNIIASGGVKDISDIYSCKNLGLYGVICGKSIYSGSLSLKEALEVAKS